MPSTYDKDFALSALQIHNEYRKKHGVPELKLSDELCSYAQEWANTMAKKDHFAHRPKCKYGENIFAYSSSNPNAKISAETICKDWYDEIKNHTFGAEPRMIRSGHFSQMIWKESAELGIAYAKSKKGKIYVVANYNPIGNMMGQFANNVPPLIK